MDRDIGCLMGIMDGVAMLSKEIRAVEVIMGTIMEIGMAVVGDMITVLMMRGVTRVTGGYIVEDDTISRIEKSGRRAVSDSSVKKWRAPLRRS